MSTFDIQGTDRSERIEGTSAGESIYTGDGLDTVSAGPGNDSVNGSVTDGNVSYYAVTGSKLISGGDGDDFLYGGPEEDSISGDAGNDTIYGDAGNDHLQGGTGNDEIWAGHGNDAVDGGDGDDTIETGDGEDSVLGGTGNDHINGKLDDPVTGQFSFHTYAGAKQISAGAGDDFVYGSSNDDLLRGESGNDSLHGDAGNDSLDGGSGNDQLFGATGNDTLASYAGMDTLDGGAGDDRYLIGSPRFTLQDESGSDSALVLVDFVKMPSFIEQIEYAPGVRALPYWISALLPDEASGLGYLSNLGSTRTYGYAFPQTPPSYLATDSDYLSGWKAFNTAQIFATENLLTHVSDLLNLQFVKTNSALSINTLSFANNSQTASAGYALVPSSSSLGSDVFLADTPGNSVMDNGTYAALTLTHEIGHALGLKHPFSSQDSTGDMAPPPYLPASDDQTGWTVMSYNSDAAQYAFEFSALDVAALQYLYGPSLKSRTGDDAYAISTSSPNFVWDGSGTDLLDASALTEPVTLFLTPGYWGHVGINPAPSITAAGQVTVNFGTRIENLKGGPQDDHLYGADIANLIQGGAGNDVLQGWDGSDTLIGGVGNDTLYGGASTDWGFRNRGTDVAVFSGARSNYQIAWSSVTDALTVASTEEGTDTLWDIEQLRFADGTLLTADLRDNAAPLLMGTAPRYGALRVPMDTPITLTFNEPVQPGSGSFILKRGSETLQTLTARDSHIQFESATVTVTVPKDLLSPDTTYALSFSANAVKDLAGNNWAAPSTAYTFTLVNSSSSVDSVAPAIDGSVWRKMVAPTSPIQIPFTEQIVRGTGSIVLYEYNANTGEALSLASTSSIAGKNLTVTPAQALSASKNYAIAFMSGAIKDLAGNDFNFPDEATSLAPRLDLRITVDNTPPVAPKFITTAGFASSVDPQVTFTTSLGSVVMELYADEAPVSTANMLAYVNSGFYDGSLFHRVIPNFVAQGGGYAAGMVPLTSGYASILNEASNGLQNLRGTVAMARTADFNSATSQFYINYTHNAALDSAYAVFGKVVSGMSVVDRMADLPTQTVNLTYENVPVSDITTVKATQTLQGQWTSSTGLLSLSDLERNATWEYSLNSGSTWFGGHGNYLRVPDGFYKPGSLQVRQTDAQGLVSTAYVFPGSLQVNQASSKQLTATTVFWKDWETHPKTLAGVQLSPELTEKTDTRGVLEIGNLDLLPSDPIGRVTFSPSLESPTNAKASISLADVLATLKIYLGKTLPESYASPLNYVAADFDASGSVTLSDVLQLLKYYLGKNTGTIKPEWAFVDASGLTASSSDLPAGASDPVLSKTNAFPHAINLDVTNTESLQLVGVLRGDVDGSWTPAVN